MTRSPAWNCPTSATVLMSFLPVIQCSVCCCWTQSQRKMGPFHIRAYDGRWDFATQAQEISLNYHCKCEQWVHFASGSFFNFNGTAGVLQAWHSLFLGFSTKNRACEPDRVSCSEARDSDLFVSDERRRASTKGVLSVSAAQRHRVFGYRHLEEENN